MSVDLHEEADGKVLVVNLSGKLTKEDYQRFVPEVERLIKQHGTVRLLVQMHDFHGWTAGAVARHQVRHQALQRHRAPGPGRREQVGGRHGHLLQAVHEGEDPLLRRGQRRGGAGLDQGGNRASGGLNAVRQAGAAAPGLSELHHWRDHPSRISGDRTCPSRPGSNLLRNCPANGRSSRSSAIPTCSTDGRSGPWAS